MLAAFSSKSDVFKYQDIYEYSSMFYVNYIHNLLSIGYNNLALTFFKLYIKIVNTDTGMKLNKETIQIILSLTFELIDEDVDYFIKLLLKIIIMIKSIDSGNMFEGLLNIIMLKYFLVMNNKILFDQQLKSIKESSYYGDYNLYFKLNIDLMSYEMKVTRMDNNDNELEFKLREFKHVTKKAKFNRLYIEVYILIAIYYVVI